MKTCKKCMMDKECTAFSKLATSPDGLQSRCKACVSAYQKAYAAAHPEVLRTRRLKWREANAVHKKAYDAQYAQRNREVCNKANATYKKKNRHKANADFAAHYARKILATPKWAIAFFIEEAYHLAGLRSKAFGFPWHVDHIVPLKSKYVCGLHCEANLRVIPGEENMRKSNKFWPDMALVGGS